MSNSNLDLVRHMLMETTFILKYVEGKTKEQVIDDEVMCRAMVRSIEIIGEASKKMMMSFDRIILILNGKRWRVLETN
jgi:uncharacterized protein with HEPN domain